MRITPFAVGLTLTAILASGCAQSSDTDEENGGSVAPEASQARPTTSPDVTVSTFLPPGEGAGALTYDEAAVPAGATSDVQVRVQEGRTHVQFTGTGLAADRDFGAHVHTRPCGEDPADAGPHYQNEADPAAGEGTPSTDPAYANPENEIWLDFTTDADGNARTSTMVDWEFREGEAQSLVLHEHHTSTEEGEAGSAGDRLACVSVSF